MPNDRDTHFLGFAEIVYNKLDEHDYLWLGVDDKPKVLTLFAQCAYDLMQSGCVDINNAQMQQGVRLHPHAMLRAVADLTQWPD